MTPAHFLILHPEPAAPAMLVPMLEALGHDGIEAASYGKTCNRPLSPAGVVLGVDPVEPEHVRLLASVRRAPHEGPVPLIVLFTAAPKPWIGKDLHKEAMAVLRFPLPARQLQAALIQALGTAVRDAPREQQGTRTHDHELRGVSARPAHFNRITLPSFDSPQTALHPQVRTQSQPPLLPQAHAVPEPQPMQAGANPASPSLPLRPLKEALAGPERAILIQALQACGWNRNETAEALEISRSTLFHKMKRHNLFEYPAQSARQSRF